MKPTQGRTVLVQAEACTYPAIVTSVKEDVLQPGRWLVSCVSFGKGSIYFHEDLPEKVDHVTQPGTLGSFIRELAEALDRPRWFWPPRA